MIICTPERPGVVSGVYHLPYIEGCMGQRHGYMTRQGVEWTRTENHPADPRCPECGEA